MIGHNNKHTMYGIHHVNKSIINIILPVFYTHLTTRAIAHFLRVVALTTDSSPDFETCTLAVYLLSRSRIITTMFSQYSGEFIQCPPPPTHTHTTISYAITYQLNNAHWGYIIITHTRSMHSDNYVPRVRNYMQTLIAALSSDSGSYNNGEQLCQTLENN